MSATPTAAATQCIQVDESVYHMLQELQAMDAADDNAVSTLVMPPMNTTTTLPQTSGWVVEPPADSPMITWTEGGYRYKVQNPANRGSVHLKLEVQRQNVPVHTCDIYTEMDSEEYRCAMDLAMRLENMWVDRVSGVPKTDGLTRTMRPETDDAARYCTTSFPPKRSNESVSPPRRRPRPSGSRKRACVTNPIVQ